VGEHSVVDTQEMLQRIEQEIAETRNHIDHQRHTIEILREHGHSRDLPTAEGLLKMLTVSLDVLCRQRATLRRESERHSAATR